MRLVAVVGAVCLIVIIGARCLPNSNGQKLLKTGRMKATHTRLNQLRQAIIRFERKHGTLPPTLDALGANWSALLTNAELGASEYSELPLDAWGSPFLYRVTPNGFLLSSAGPDGKFNGVETQDDITVRVTMGRQ